VANTGQDRAARQALGRRSVRRITAGIARPPGAGELHLRLWAVYPTRFMQVTIRPAALGDLESIVAYNAAMAEETEHLDLDRDRLRQGVRAVLADPSKGFYIVAEAEGRIAGQMMITFEWSDWRNGTFWWIQSVYVHPEFRRRGIFKQLYRHAAGRAEADSSVCGLRLYVEQENRNAQQAYLRLGMRKAAYDVYEVDFVIKRQSGPQISR
jgi:ribosomal protein S18 acetylase RimI-like enzyme